MKKIVPELKMSSMRIGQLYPILLDYYGNIIDGEHRKSVNCNWKVMRLDHIKTEKDRLIARIVANTVRRNVSPEEKTAMLSELGEMLLREGVKPGNIALKIAEETGMSYSWVMKYLSDKFKDGTQSERASSAAHRVARRNRKNDAFPIELMEPSQDAVVIKSYRNTGFVNIMVKRLLYEKLEEKSKKLKTKPDILIYNALMTILKI